MKSAIFYNTFNSTIIKKCSLDMSPPEQMYDSLWRCKVTGICFAFHIKTGIQPITSNKFYELKRNFRARQVNNG